MFDELNSVFSILLASLLYICLQVARSLALMNRASEAYRMAGTAHADHILLANSSGSTEEVASAIVAPLYCLAFCAQAFENGT